MTDDLSPTLKEFIEDIADANNIPVGMLRQQFERNLGIDLSDVSDDDAETFIDALDNDEFDDACDVLREYGADDESITMFRQQMESVAESQSEGDSGNSDSAGSDSDSSGLSESEIDAKIQDATPSAEEIAGELKQQLGGGGGGGGGGTPGREQPTQSPQEQQGNQMGQLLSLVQLMNDGGGGLGDEFQEMAMKSFVADMRKPDLGDLLEKKYYEQVLGSEAVDDIYGDLMPETPEGDEDEDDGPFAEFS